MARVLCHISCQDHVDYTFASVLLLLLREVFKEVEIFPKQELDRFRCVPVLLNGYIMEAKSPISHKVYMVGVSEAVMVVIVASAGRDRRDHIEIVQLCDLVKVTMLEEEIHHLSDISAVKVVMVFDIPSIPLAYFIQEADKLVVVDDSGL